ncbi:MAG: 16S rRNA (guanine(527)-N(7))-methyltransferase RsmG [Bacteroidetes bacterium]|nr:16S rRNA (guanine(527)-N(7))-methyltransferase RsmG [Bacteroidota bacterium]
MTWSKTEKTTFKRVPLEGVGLIHHYFPNLSEKQLEQFHALGNLYLQWNEKINVISRKDTENLYTNHILHSLGIAKIITFKPGTRVLDVGTGGGFPGIPLAILFPDTIFHLVDSVGKKITVVQGIVDELNLKNVTAECIRAERVNGKFDFVVSRAVTRMKEFYGWIHQKISPGKTNSLENGILYLKGGDLDQEMAELKRPYQEFELNKYFDLPFFETKKVIYVPC